MKLNLMLKNFTDLNDFEKEFILRHRNDPSIAKFMKTNYISYEEHLNFIQNLKNDCTKRYFLVYKNDQAIGVIDFINITINSCEFGLYGIKKGVGNLLMEEIKNYAFNVLKVKILKACVFKENTKALNLYLKHSPVIIKKSKKMYYLEYIQKLIVAKLSSIDFSWKDELTDYTIKNKDIILNFNYNEKIILKNFINLNHKEKEKIRLYRNHFEIKKYLYHTHYISKYEHKNFISNLRKTTQKSYYCVIYNNKILGSVNFEKKSKEIIEFGFYANPFSKILGLGRILEHISMFYAFKIQNCDILQLEVFEDNMQIIGLHKMFNFETTSSFTFQNKSVLKMQLNNPNRDIVS